jgi:hypothetical protein
MVIADPEAVVPNESKRGGNKGNPGWKVRAFGIAGCFDSLGTID